MPHNVIRIVVEEDGSVKTDFLNFSGTECLTAGHHLHTLLAQFGVCLDQTSFLPKPELAYDSPLDVTANGETFLSEMQKEE